MLIDNSVELELHSNVATITLSISSHDITGFLKRLWTKAEFRAVTATLVSDDGNVQDLTQASRELLSRTLRVGGIRSNTGRQELVYYFRGCRM